MVKNTSGNFLLLYWSASAPKIGTVTATNIIAADRDIPIDRLLAPIAVTARTGK